MSLEYTITVYTGLFDDSGTDANVYLTIVGTKCKYNEIALKKPKTNLFEKGNVDVLKMTLEDVGDIDHIIVRHDNSGKRPGWYLEGVRISYGTKTYNFPAYRWLDIDELDGKISVTLTPGKKVYHYNYCFQYPKDRENGWSEEVNGVCHDEKNWFFTQDGNLWKIPVNCSVSDKHKNADSSKGILKTTTRYHLGDCDYYNNYIFVPVTGSENPKIEVFRSSNLSLVSVQDMFKSETSSAKKPFTSIGWCAVNAVKGKLYLSDKHMSCSNNDDKSLLYEYNIDTKALSEGRTPFLILSACYSIYDEKGKVLTLEHMQGGCFDQNGNLVVTNGYYTGVKQSWANSKGGISVFKKEAGSNKFVRIQKSNQSDHFRYQFNGKGDEPEGITYWDLDHATKAPGIEGTLHAIMLNNVGTGDDDFFFKHYREV